MPTYHLRVNGKSSAVDSWDPDQPLLYVLRNALGLRGAKFGCGLGQCGSCTVWIDGQAARSCITTVELRIGVDVYCALRSIPHQASVGDVMLDDTTSQDDHPGSLCEDS